jgi:hypothetical protein
MNNYQEVENTRAIFVKFLPSTNYKGSRVKFLDKYRESESKIVSFSYDFGYLENQGYNQLICSGFNVVGRASTKDYFIFFIKNWGEDYKSIKELINTNELEKIIKNDR